MPATRTWCPFCANEKDRAEGGSPFAGKTAPITINPGTDALRGFSRLRSHMPGLGMLVFSFARQRSTPRRKPHGQGKAATAFMSSISSVPIAGMPTLSSVIPDSASARVKATLAVRGNATTVAGSRLRRVVSRSSGVLIFQNGRQRCTESDPWCRRTMKRHLQEWNKQLGSNRSRW
jgi:hypothetical protein